MLKSEALLRFAQCASRHVSLPARVPVGTEGKGEEVGSEAAKVFGWNFSNRVESAKCPEREVKRAMASKELPAAGFAAVSREITGEIRHEFVGQVCFTFNLT